MRERYRKIMLVVLPMLMVLGGFNGTFVGGNRAYADEVAFAGGTGTALNPFQICFGLLFQTVS